MNTSEKIENRSTVETVNSSASATASNASAESSSAQSTTETSPDLNTTASGGSKETLAAGKTATPEEEKITLTSRQLEAERIKARSIAERRSKREFEKRLAEEVEKVKTQYASQPSAQIPPPPGENHAWDETLKQWVPLDMTLAEYQKRAVLAAQYRQQQMQQVQPPPNASSTPSQASQPVSGGASNQFSEEADYQAISCAAENPDFETVMKGAPITSTMCNAAALDEKGMENLYQLMKENPNEVYRISQLPPMQQQHKMWELNSKRAQERAKRIKTNATPPPSAVTESTHITVSPSDMSFSDKKNEFLNRKWKR